MNFLFKKSICACLLLTAATVAQAQFSGGSGTSGSPYLIVAPADLDNVRNHLSAGTYFELTNDIDLTTYLAVGGAGNNPFAAGVTGKTTTDMQQQATFTTAPANWDFTASTGVWGICLNTYPFLQWQGISCGGTPTLVITNLNMY